MDELALFAGAGGGLLAGHILGWNTVCAVEYGSHQRRILAARQNDRSLRAFPIWDDIRTFDGKPWRGIANLVSGGFPCQAFSTAAHGANIPKKNLWHEMRRIVRESEPSFVFGENVSTKAIDAACDDLKQMGYKTKAISLSAKDLGADHIRERHWLLAYADDPRELLRGVHAETSELQSIQTGIWRSDAGVSGMVNGVAGRMDRLQASGNGQVPVVAATACILLVNEAAKPWIENENRIF